MAFSRALFWTLAIRNLSVLLFSTQTKAILIERQYFHHMFDDKFLTERLVNLKSIIYSDEIKVTLLECALLLCVLER